MGKLTLWWHFCLYVVESFIFVKQKPSLLEWPPLRPNKLFGNDPIGEKKDQADDILRALDSIEDEEVRADALEKLLERLRHKQSLLLENYELEDLKQEDRKVAVCVWLSYHDMFSLCWAVLPLHGLWSFVVMSSLSTDRWLFMAWASWLCILSDIHTTTFIKHAYVMCDECLHRIKLKLFVCNINTKLVCEPLLTWF